MGISDLADYCEMREGIVYLALKELELQDKLVIIKRYSCPKGHYLSVPSYCESCERLHPEHEIGVKIFVKKKATGLTRSFKIIFIWKVLSSF
ncbi:MAG: hypothetical protein AAF316_00370 [Cyanobacteria bacterium P01_A01_bin.80]